MKDFFIPATYEEWKHCIIEDCGLKLTPDYISERISALNNEQDEHTRQFVKLYGTQHLKQVISWFMQAQTQETAAAK